MGVMYQVCRARGLKFPGIFYCIAIGRLVFVDKTVNVHNGFTLFLSCKRIIQV